MFVISNKLISLLFQLRESIKYSLSQLNSKTKYFSTSNNINGNLKIKLSTYHLSKVQNLTV